MSGGTFAVTGGFWPGIRSPVPRCGNADFDCDGDTLLIQVDQIGAACHEGYRSCFFRSVGAKGLPAQITEPQLETPEQIYGKR